MRAPAVVVAALGIVAVLGASLPAHADDDGWHHGWHGHGWHGHGWHEWREHHGGDWDDYGYVPGYYYYAPPPYYYAPAPYYYAPPGVTFGFSFH